MIYFSLIDSALLISVLTLVATILTLATRIVEFRSAKIKNKRPKKKPVASTAISDAIQNQQETNRFVAVRWHFIIIFNLGMTLATGIYLAIHHEAPVTNKELAMAFLGIMNLIAVVWWDTLRIRMKIEDSN